MLRLGIYGLPAMIMTAVWLYAFLDVIATDEMMVRNLPKISWVFIVLFFPAIGAIAWLGFGRPLYTGWAPGSTDSRPVKRVVGPEDKPEWDHPRRNDGNWTRSRPPMAPAEPALREDPAGPAQRQKASAETDAAKERRLMEWEAELAKREADLAAASADDVAAPSDEDEQQS